MNTKTFLLALSLGWNCVPGAFAQSTAFTYQGSLTANSSPANGAFDLRFTLFDASAGGTMVSGPVTVSAVAVKNGLFTATLDFGQSAFPGADRWLEVAVQPQGGSGFTVLSPRQRFTATPYAIQAATVAPLSVTSAKIADHSVTAAKLSTGSGANGKVLKMNGGVLTWGNDFNSGGTVNSVASGTGLTGGPITGAGTLAIDTTVVPRLTANNTFTGPNTFNGANSFPNAANNFVGSFTGNGAGLTNLSVSGTNVSAALFGDVTGTQNATVVARIRGVNVLATAPAANQHLRFNGTNWTPAAVALSTDVSGALGLTNGGTGAATPPGARANLGAAASGANSDITSLAGLQTLAVRATNSQTSDLQDWQNSAGTTLASVSAGGVLSGNGSGLTSLNATGLSSGTVADARLSANIPLLNGTQTFSGANTFNGANSSGNAANSFVGSFTGNGAGLTNVSASSSNFSGTLSGDVAGTQNATIVARIRGVNVASSAPAANQLLRFNGANCTPAAVALGSDVSG